MSPLDEGVVTEAPAEVAPAEEPVPASEEQEQAPPAEGGVDSGAQKSEDEGSEEPKPEEPQLTKAQQVIALARELAEDDEETAAAFKEEFGTKVADSEKETLRQESAAQRSTKAYEGMKTSYDGRIAYVDQLGQSHAKQLGEMVGKSALDVEEDAGYASILDVGKLGQAFGKTNQLAGQAGQNYAETRLQQWVFDVVQRHPSAQKFTDEDWRAMAPAPKQDATGADIPSSAYEFIQAVLIGALNAAGKSDPEGLRQNITKEVKEELDAAGTLAKLAEMLPSGNGKGPVSRTKGKGSDAQPKSEQEAINWHATDKWSTKQLLAWRKTQAAKES